MMHSSVGDNFDSFQIIMAKKAGGPKPPKQKADWDED